MDAAALIQRYGSGFAAGATDTALEYYLAAARAAGGGQGDLVRLLKDLLARSHAFGFLLGGSQGGGEPCFSACASNDAPVCR